MLAELAIHNLVIVEHARLTPGIGLTVISGETGAGKSLLMSAIEMVSGGRTQAQLIGPFADAATVTAVFQVDRERAEALTAACSVPPAEGCYLLRRRVGPGGRSQAWINDVPVTATALRAAAALLVEVHVQHEALRLSEAKTQLRLLDAYGSLTADAVAYQALHERALALAHQLAELDGGERESLKELDYLSFQAREIDSLQPVRGEVAELEARHALLSSAGHWREVADQAVQLLTEDERSAGMVLARLGKRLADAPEASLQEASRACAAAQEAVQEAARACSDALERLHPDPAEHTRIEERLNAYHELFRKHGEGEEALVTAWQRLTTRIGELSTLADRRQAAARELAAVQEARLASGAALASARAKSFARLAKEVQGHLRDLGMPKASLGLTAQPLPEPTAMGTVHQEFLVQTNPGMPAGLLGEIASGGEAARITLALAEALAERDPIPVMVFDEVDSGVGGRLGAVIGAKLAQLARHRTVLAVTHTPQLAAAAHRQYLVSKQQGDHQTRVDVTEVTGENRLKEISEMLGGGRAAVDQARVLLGGGPS